MKTDHIVFEQLPRVTMGVAVGTGVLILSHTHIPTLTLAPAPSNVSEGRYDKLYKIKIRFFVIENNIKLLHHGLAKFHVHVWL
jgi:hypothetical protein